MLVTTKTKDWVQQLFMHMSNVQQARPSMKQVSRFCMSSRVWLVIMAHAASTELGTPATTTRTDCHSRADCDRIVDPFKAGAKQLFGMVSTIGQRVGTISTGGRPRHVTNIEACTDHRSSVPQARSRFCTSLETPRSECHLFAICFRSLPCATPPMCHTGCIETRLLRPAGVLSCEMARVSSSAAAVGNAMCWQWQRHCWQLRTELPPDNLKILGNNSQEVGAQLCTCTPLEESCTEPNTVETPRQDADNLHPVPDRGSHRPWSPYCHCRRLCSQV